MGQVSLLQGILHFALHCTAVISALAASGLCLEIKPRWRVALICAATFAAAFVAHIITFITLGLLLGEDVPPQIHRPVVGMVWGMTAGLTAWLMLKRSPLAFFSTALFTTWAYFVFVLLRPLVP